MAKKYKCPYCGESHERDDLVNHIQDEHNEYIPLGFTPLRVAFNSINYGTLSYDGRCIICGGPTKWDENKGRYDRLCSKKSCHDTYVKNFEENMARVQGVTRISKSVSGQEKMLANRKISGRYRFKDGGVRTYTGSYEKETLKFMDQVMDCKSEDIMCPGPSMQYEYQGELHWYIPDIYYVPYNLVIEVKDGGDKPNTRNMPDYRARQIAKEKHIIEKTNFNYLRLTNKDFSQLLSTMSDLKMQLKDNSTERVLNINENMFAAAQGMMPMQNKKDNNVYIVNYLQNNVFSGESEFAVSDSPMFDNVFYRDEEGKLRKGSKEVFEDTSYNVYYKSDITWDSLEKSLSDSEGEFVEESFIYETVFGDRLYTPDQIKFAPFTEEVEDEYHVCNRITEATRGFLIDSRKHNDSIDAFRYAIDTYKDFNSFVEAVTEVGGKRNG